VCVCFITAGPITKLFAWGGDGTREEPGTLTQGAPVFPGSSRLGFFMSLVCPSQIDDTGCNHFDDDGARIVQCAPACGTRRAVERQGG